ncbi:hypothetical protein FH972_014344 [Carpinus fangiana]|uniref:Uncharacterized protein n=1 Tax=Carpinus fangiana TaxID=176857 RepID=A0A5N6RCX6_9ROSI|nr:hypothetical protein FH972_014344 [Carpinus fangiana]
MASLGCLPSYANHGSPSLGFSSSTTNGILVTELPSVDMFMTTVDPVLEPSIITINTVLSLLAVDYPAHKLACYVSNDGCSPLTFYSLVKASKFAKLWVPFCKKHNIPDRAPLKYFSDDCLSFIDSSNWEFQQEWKTIEVIHNPS